jgi:GNAT superfamily N-acetyltransferase
MGQDLKSSYITCFVASDGQGAVIGYYTLSMASFSLEDLTEDQQKALGVRRYKDVPAALVGRLAVDQRFAKQGFGSVLLGDAIARVKGSGVGTFAVLVDAKDDKAKTFYEHHGFTPFPSNPMKLFLPLSNVDPNA